MTFFSGPNLFLGILASILSSSHMAPQAPAGAAEPVPFVAPAAGEWSSSSLALAEIVPGSGADLLLSSAPEPGGEDERTNVPWAAETHQQPFSRMGIGA